MGRIIRDGRGGPPIANIEISAIPPGNATKSQTNGAFILEFLHSQAGDTVDVVVTLTQSSNLSVVNKLDLEACPLPNDPDARILRIYLCEKERWNECAAHHYGIRLKDEARQNSKQSGNSERLKKVNGFIDNTVMLTAKAMSEAVPDWYKEALRLSLDKKVDDALEILAEDRMLKRGTEAGLSPEQVSRGYVLRGQLLTLKFLFPEAKKAYEDAVHTAPDSFDAHIVLGVFLQELNRYDEAHEVYERCLKLAIDKNSPSEIALAKKYMGSLYRSEDRLGESEDALNEALERYQGLADQNPQIYRRYVAATLNEIGNLYIYKEDTKKAHDAYQQARELYSQLAKQSPEIYLPKKMNTLSNLGVLYQKERLLDKSQFAFRDAISIYHALDERTQEDYEPEFSTTLLSMGTTHLSLNQREDAQRAWKQALEIFHRLAGQNPRAYLPKEAMTLTNMGGLHVHQNQPSEAEDVFKKALSIYSRLAKDDPSVFLSNKYACLVNLGYVYRMQNLTKKAFDSYEKALRICEELATKNPEKYSEDCKRIKGYLKDLADADQEIEHR
jgi:tetratricopeptide (TPR) repeat protein